MSGVKGACGQKIQCQDPCKNPCQKVAVCKDPCQDPCKPYHHHQGNICVRQQDPCNPCKPCVVPCNPCVVPCNPCVIPCCPDPCNPSQSQGRFCCDK